MTYRVAGAPELTMDKLAGPVDEVLAQQMKHLKAYIETGKRE